MYKPQSVKDLALDLLSRSSCAVQVSAVLSDSHGIFAWGWNSAGCGFGLHAEIHALLRANRSRLKGSTLTVAGKRKKSGNVVCSFPCIECLPKVIKAGIARVEYRTKTGEWEVWG